MLLHTNPPFAKTKGVRNH